MDFKQRQQLERNIVTLLLTYMASVGWMVYAVDDGGDEDEKVASIEEAMAAIFAVDESLARFKHESGEKGWVSIILGNGIDCLSDYGYKAANDPNGWNGHMEHVYAKVDEMDFNV